MRFTINPLLHVSYLLLPDATKPNDRYHGKFFKYLMSGISLLPEVLSTSAYVKYMGWQQLMVSNIYPFTF